nr:DMT family transporter [uncultured Halomonas sp.]
MSDTYRRERHLALPTPSIKWPLTSAVVAIGFVLCWSSGFVGSRLAVGVDTPPVALYAWRFALATVLAGLWWLFNTLRHGGETVGWRTLTREATCGSLTMGVYLLAMLLGIQQGVSAGVAALIGALQPLFAAALAALWLREMSSRAQWLGMLVATLGAGLCVLDDAQGMGGATPWAYLLPVLAVGAVTLGSLMTPRPGERSLSLPARLTVQLATTTVLFFVAAGLYEGGDLAPPTPTLNNALIIAFLVILASFGGYGFFVKGLSHFGVTRLSTLIYLTPAVTMGWAALMFGELPGLLGLAGMAVVALGVLQTLRARPHNRSGANIRAPRREATAPEAYVARAKIKSQTPWPSRSPRASNLVNGRNSGRDT